MKVRNKHVIINYLKNDKKIGSTKVKNRILDNYLDHLCWKMLPLTEREALFPDLAGGFKLNSNVYLRIGATQTITDSSTSMAYDLSQAYDPFLTQINVSDNLVTIDTVYTVDTSATSGTIYGLGFGQTYGATTDWLLAFVDVENVDIDVTDIDTVQIIRSDEYEAEGTLIAGVDDFLDYFPFHLSYFEDFGIGAARWAWIGDIYFSNSATAATEDDSYDISTDLTITNTATGELTFTGFSNWAYNGASTPPQYQTIGWKYLVYYYDEIGETIVEDGEYTYYKTLGTSTNDGGTLTVKYKFERGE